MTAVPNWYTGGWTDAELARAAAGGDRGAFAGIYDRYADRLHDFCVGMLRDRDGAEDCVQDTFCIAATRLPQLRESDKLRPWLYAIARNEALRRLRDRRRETPSDELPDTVSHDPGPDTLAARTELADLIAEAAGGLSDRDRSILELAYRHGLDGPELAEALGVSPGNANKLVYRLRETIELSLGALLVSRRARNNPGRCPDLAAILGDWDGRFSVLMRKRVARHIESCPTCDEDRRRLVSPAALLAGAPVFIPAPAWLRERTLSDIRLDSLATPIAGGTVEPGGAGVAGGTDSGHADNLGAAGDQAPPIPVDRGDDAHRRRRNVMLLIAAFVAALIISLGLTIVWVYGRNTTITPSDVTDTAPTSVSIAPAAPTPSSPIPRVPAPAPPTAEVTTTVPAVATPPTQVPTPVQPPAPPETPVVSEPPAQPPVRNASPPPPPPTAPTVSLRPSIPSSQPPTQTSVVLQPIPRTQTPTRTSIVMRPPTTTNPPR